MYLLFGLSVFASIEADLREQAKAVFDVLPVNTQD